MMSDELPSWLKWAREIAAIGQSGLHFSSNVFDQQRYQRLVDLSSEILAQYTDVPVEIYRDVFFSQKGYATPKVDVRAAVFKDQQVLMVQERTDGGWSLPGGWADVNEAPSSMVEREVWEESGFRVKAKRLVGVYESNHDREPIQVFHAYKLIFLCDLISGSETTSIETSAVGFFSLDQLPPFSPYRTRQNHIDDAYAAYQDPQRAACFD